MHPAQECIQLAQLHNARHTELKKAYWRGPTSIQSQAWGLLHLHQGKASMSEQIRLDDS